MRLGLLTAPFPETPLSEVVDWTAANGFESIEGTDALVKRGFLLARDVLRPYVK